MKIFNWIHKRLCKNNTMLVPGGTSKTHEPENCLNQTHEPQNCLQTKVLEECLLSIGTFGSFYEFYPIKELPEDEEEATEASQGDSKEVNENNENVLDDNDSHTRTENEDTALKDYNAIKVKKKEAKHSLYKMMKKKLMGKMHATTYSHEKDVGYKKRHSIYNHGKIYPDMVASVSSKLPAKNRGRRIRFPVRLLCVDSECTDDIEQKEKEENDLKVLEITFPNDHKNGEMETVPCKFPLDSTIVKLPAKERWITTDADYIVLQL